MPASQTETQFAAALDSLLADVREDRAVLAAVLCGSLAHDTVWARSDVDLVLVTIDDRKVESRSLALNADGVNVHALCIPRAEFRKLADGALRNSFMHSFLAKGRLLFTHDESIARLCESLHEMGERDARLQRFSAAAGALPPLYKARKWLLTRGDLEYTALWLLYAATPLARVEVIGAGLLADREVIPQARRLNPALFDVIYTRLLNEPKSRSAVEEALAAAERYLADRARELFAPVLEYLDDAGEVRSASEIEAHFERTFGLTSAVMACEYLADLAVIGKAAGAIRLTKRSTADVQELAFFALAEAPDGA